MLEYLSIKNLALIENLEVEFAAGLNVITGVTGAGKTLLLKALQLALGERADYELLAGDSESAELIALFTDVDLPAAASSPAELEFRRVLKQSRQSRAYINDQRSRLNKVEDIRSELIDFHGQHEGQAVFDKSYPRRVLDRYGDYDELLSEYRQTYEEFIDYKKELSELEDPGSDYQQRLQLFSYQLQELDELEPLENEWEDIEERRRALEAVEEIDSHLRETLSILESDNPVSGDIARLAKNIEKVAEFKDQLEPWNSELIEINSRLEDLRRQVHETREEMAHSEREYEELLNRRGSWLQLARKHNRAPETLYEHYRSLKNELEKLQGREARVEELEKLISKLKPEVEKLAQKLTEVRRKTADKLEKKVIDRLKRLKLEEAVFEIEIVPAKPGPHGCDSVGWLFSSHSSHNPGPLADRVSGGEISRVLLAIKSALAEADTTPVLVFDEIDTGISGEEAESVGKLLAGLAHYHQVICITHLPLVAAQADHHILLKRDDSEQEVIIAAQVAGSGERVAELSRLISGDSDSKVSRRQANQLLEKAQ